MLVPISAPSHTGGKVWEPYLGVNLWYTEGSVQRGLC